MRIFNFLLVWLAPLFALSQQQPLSGHVRDADGLPIEGVTVAIANSPVVSLTDANGYYTLSSVRTGATLIFSSIGYISHEVTYEGQATIDVALAAGVQGLEEVVVIGYGQVRRGDATGALTSIKADAATRGFAPNAQDMLVGKVAGVNITNAGGSPSGGATIRIRGGSSLSASNDPLVIIDGLPIDNTGIGGVGNLLSAINPTDIETFTVLKDASATAIYGSRASNGVILITTKRGSKGRTQLSYDGNASLSTRKNSVGVLSGDAFREFIATTFAGASNEDEVVGKLGTANTDWQDEIFEQTANTEHNLSAFGAIKNTVPYRVSVGYSDVNGILKTSNMERMISGISLTPSLLDNHLNVSVNAKGMYVTNRFANQGAIGSAVAMDPTQPVYDDNSPYGGFFSWVGQDGALLGVATKNPVSLLEMTNDRSKVYNLIGNTQVDYRLHFLPEVKLNLNVGLDYSKSNGSKYIDPFAPSDYLNGGFDGNWEQQRRNSILEFYAQYAKDFDFLNSRFDIMGGYSWQHYWIAGNNADYRISKFDANGNPEVVSINNYENENYIVSFFGRVNYSIANRYLLTFTLRNDGSSRFHQDNRWGIFPSAAVAWRAKNEPFLANVNAVSDLKVRLGWGVTGQQDINQGNYPYMGRYQQSVGEQASYIRGYMDGMPLWAYLMRPTSYNPALKWESTTTYNAGIDYGFFNNRLSGAIDFYHRKTEDLINAETRTAAGTNFSEFVAANIGSLENTGVEFSTNVEALQKGDWTLTVGGNIAYNDNKITQLSNLDGENPIRRYGHTGGDGGFQLLVHSVGNPSGMYYVYEQIYNNNGKPIEGLYVDRDDDGMITENDLRPYQRSVPTWTGGLNTRLTWKNWDLAIAGHGSLGNYNYNAIAANSAELDRARVFANEFLANRTQSAFDSGFQLKQVLSDHYVQDASFFRVDNIVLGWAFKQLGKAPLNGRIYGAAHNPLVFTSYSGLDPEVNGGVDNDFYPRPLTVMLGLNLNF